jgi:alpha-beta hydrolase superfamily lysophospholipase
MGGSIALSIMIEHPVFNQSIPISGVVLAAPAISIIDKTSDFIISTVGFFSNLFNIQNIPFTSEDVTKNTRVPSEQKRYLENEDNYSHVRVLNFLKD